MKNLLSKIQQFDFFETLKHTTNYFGAQLLIQILGVASMWVYTYYLDTTNYGYVHLFNTFIPVMGVLLAFNVYSAVGRYYFEEKEDWQAFIGTTLISTLVLSFVGFTIIFLLRHQIANLIEVPVVVILLLFPMAIFYIIPSIFNQLFIAQKKSMLVSKGQVSMSYLRFGGAVVAMLWLIPNYYSKILGDVIGAGLVSTVMFMKIWPNIKWTFSWEHLKYILVFTLPMIPFTLSGFILNFFDSLMINASESSASTGLYGFAYKIGMLFFGFDQAIQNAAKTDFFKWMNAKNYPAVKGQIKSMVKFQVLAAMFLILFAGDMGYVLAANKEFTVSLPIVPIIVMGYVFFALYQYYSRLLFYSKKTAYASLVAVVGAAINVGLNYLYIPEYGYVAAAYTTVVSFLVMLILGWIIVVWYLKMPAPPLPFMLYGLGIILLYLAFFYGIEQLELAYWLTLLCKMILFGIGGLYLFWDKIKVALG